MVLVGVVIVGGWGLLLALLMGVGGVFVECWCFVGSRLVWSGSEMLVWWGRFCCWRVSGFHALHCWRLSCVWAVVLYLCRLVFLVVFLFVECVAVVGVMVVGVVLLCNIVLVVFPDFCFLEVGSSYSG